MANKVYDIITDVVLKELEKGQIPWHQPWVTECPKNLITKKPYRGINVFLLSMRKYSSPYWLSFRQVNQLGGKVKKGQKSTMVIFWKQMEIKEEKEDGTIETKTIPVLRYYRVFNTLQTEGIEDKIPQTEINPNFCPIEACEKTISSMPKKPVIRHNEPRAYYVPETDYVNMPRFETFKKEEFYYSTLFHELGHSTGHKSRLARKTLNEIGQFGSSTYSKEELVAEMTAAFLCGHHRIEQQTIPNSVAYIQAWLKVLRNDSKFVISAAAQAQKAADFILGEI